VFDHYAISIGTHILSDFYAKTGGYLDNLFTKEDLAMPAELVYVNFDLRTKVFIHQINEKR
jgi:hypothetical protein